MSITNYEEFLRAFHGTEKQQYDAGLLLTMRDWLIRLDDSAELDDGKWDLDSLLNKEPYLCRVEPEEKHDVVSRILDETFQAFRAISVRMRDNIIRENVKLPVYKVREMNRYGMMWLSRRPGRTVREKASGTNAIMAVARRMTLDTGENRLFLEYLRQLSGILQDKLSVRPASERSADEEAMLLQIQMFLRNDTLEEIRPWGNLPPNNTLLSDQNYRKIWNGWSSLQQIDDLVEQDAGNLPGRMCTIFFVELLKSLKRMGRVPQLPLILDYIGFRVEICTPGGSVPVLPPGGRAIYVRRGEKNVIITLPEQEISVAFEGDTIRFSGGSDTVDYPLTEYGMQTCIRDVLTALFREEEETAYVAPVMLRQQETIVDLFALHPRCCVLDGDLVELGGRLLYQDIPFGGEVFELPCDVAQAVCLSEEFPCYTIQSSLEKGDLNALGRLAHLLERYLETRLLTFLYPDAYTSLQVSLLYKAARMAYPEVRSFPKSIGAAFFWQGSDGFSNKFRNGDYLLSVDLVGDDLTYTLVRGSADPETGELIWERHPTASEPLDTPVRDRLRQLEHGGCMESEQLFALFGLDGIAHEAGRLAFFSAEPDSGWECFTIPEKPFRSMRLLQIDITRNINEFLKEHRELIGRARVHIQVFSPFLTAAGSWHIAKAGNDDALYGCALYQQRQAETKTPLWCDYLPKLAFKLLHTDFPLISKARISAQYGERVKIPIDNTFTLSKGRPDYQFDLIQSETSKSTSFVAEVRSSAFPLKEDVACRLELWYQYGSENPFTLTFRPCEGARAPFKQALVSWLPRSRVPYPVDGLPLPGFPEISSWEELAHFWGKRNEEINIPEETAQILNLLAERYCTINLGEKQFQIMGSEGKQYFTVPCTIEGRLLPVLFLESKIGPRSLNFSDMGEVSFNIAERYRAYLSSNRNGKVWFPSNKGGWQHYENDFNYNGQPVVVAFFSSNFFRSFNDSVRNVSFELVPYGQDRSGVPRYKAINICDARDDDGLEYTYYADFIRRGNVPPNWVVNGFCYFIFHTCYFGGKSVFDPDCPETVRQAFQQAKDEWVRVYERCSNAKTRGKLFDLMSLAAGDLGDTYYQIANRRIMDYLEGEEYELSNYIGYALLHYTKNRERKLWEHMQSLSPEEIVCILSKAVWGTDDFILNFPAESALRYFDVAVKYAGEEIICWEKNEQKRRDAENNLHMCFEYALGVFRMRQLSDTQIRWKLSMNDETVRKLYDWIERAIKDGIQLRTFLKLSITDKKQYEKIPDLLYALLVYITGREGDDTIKISGVDFNVD